MHGLTLVLWELGHTARSLVRVAQDWLILRTLVGRMVLRDETFAFLVHPRTDDLIGTDVYGYNDIYRPVPILRHLFKILPKPLAERIVLGFARMVPPATLSRIKVRIGNTTARGYLLTSARTPRLLLDAEIRETKRHLEDLFALANRKGVRRVGLGALLPSMTGYGKRFTGVDSSKRPAISTGHAYTAYNIAQYISLLTRKRNTAYARTCVSIVGAGGSTGKALMRTLKRVWRQPAFDMLMVDTPQKAASLRLLAEEARKSGVFASVRTSTDLASLREAEYVVVVTNATGAIIRPEHLRQGTVIIDDSQPRNTSPELSEHGCHVLDVLARVPGLDCNFDFGFRTQDKTVTFTCLAETVLATVAGDANDLAVGEVTEAVVERLLSIVNIGTQLGLVGPLPFFTFGRELSEAEQQHLLQPSGVHLVPAAE